VVTLEHRVLGVAFLALLVLSGWVTYAVFNKAFTEFVPVTLHASKTGLQLPDEADVKIRGVRVGVVRERRITRQGVALTLGIFPDSLHQIPANVSARIIPKTLFGQKYVALQVPADPVAEAIGAGDVIEEADVAIEVEKVLADIYPLLRAVQPADLNYTLTAVATALEGRGEDLGESLEVLDDYLGRVNPQVPALVEDLRLASGVSDTYRSVLPEVARLLRNAVTTGNTFVDKERKIQALFDDVARFSGTAREFLAANGDNIIRLGELGRQQLRVLARYAPEYPCLLQAQAAWIPHVDSAWRGHALHINLEVLPKQPTGYGPQDTPEYGASNGPHCDELPNPPFDQDNLAPQPGPGVVDDGVESGHNHYRAVPGFDLTSGLAGTAAERTVVNSVAAPVMGVDTGQVPDVASLLFGPLARGTEVSLR
jgi:phospholipid/cholesterol/gamma-HCH transport system substrate-binding protein